MDKLLGIYKRIHVCSGREREREFVAVKEHSDCYQIVVTSGQVVDSYHHIHYHLEILLLYCKLHTVHVKKRSINT